MKILITTDLYTTSTNGVVTSLKNLYDELNRRGHDVRILTLSKDLHSHRDGTIYYVRSMPIGVYPGIRMPLSYRNKLINELIAWNPDVVHSQCEFFSFQYALRISKLTGAPLVHTYHTMYEQYVTYVIPSKQIGKRIVRLFLKNRFKRTNRVIVPTQKIEESLRDYHMQSKISIIPSGISLDQHKKRLTKTERLKKRQELGITDNQLVLLNLGRLGEEKNIDELMHMFAQAIATNKKVILLIVGDGPARKQLQKQAFNLGLADFVIFTGMVPPNEVQDYYQLGDVFISASTSETQGLTYIEAAANGLPLLCREDLCLKNVIQQGTNGYEYTNTNEFLNGIDFIINNPEWRVAAGKHSEKIAASFDKRIFGDAIETLYYSVLSEGREKDTKNERY